jgi:hypothetical protein
LANFPFQIKQMTDRIISVQATQQKNICKRPLIYRALQKAAKESFHPFQTFSRHFQPSISKIE